MSRMKQLSTRALLAALINGVGGLAVVNLSASGASTEDGG